VNSVRVDGESGREARVCDYDWVLDIREQCVSAGIGFMFAGTGSNFRKDCVLQKVNPYQQKNTARAFEIDVK